MHGKTAEFGAEESNRRASLFMPVPAPAAPAAPGTPGTGPEACFDGANIVVHKNGASESCEAFTGSIGVPTPDGTYCVRRQGEAQIAGGIVGRLFQEHPIWYLIEPQFPTTRSRMQIHPGTRSSGCITVKDHACFDRLAKVLNGPGTVTGEGYDGYPPGNDEKVTNPKKDVDCVAKLEVSSSPGACKP